MRAGGPVEPVACHGLVVGAFSGVRYETTTVTLQPSDLVIFYTDGITEARRAGEFFGRQRMEQQLAATAGATAAAVIHQLHTAVETFQGGQRDDMAIRALRLLPSRPSDRQAGAPR